MMNSVSPPLLTPHGWMEMFRCEAGDDESPATPSTERPQPGETDAHDSLEEAAEDEQEYLRQRLRDELKREPTAEEMNEWLRQHTEGY